MKKIKIFTVFALVLSFSSLFLFGCRNNTAKDNPFAVFSGDFSAEIAVEINGNSSACVYEKQGGTASISLTSPSVLSGFVFSVSGEEITLKSGETEVSANRQIAFLPSLLSEVFSEVKENITEIKTEKTDSGTVTVIKTPNTVYHFSENGTPLYAEGIVNKAAFKITVNNFSTSEGGET